MANCFNFVFLSQMFEDSDPEEDEQVEDNRCNIEHSVNFDWLLEVLSWI